jgi:amino acid transporter
MDPEITLKRSLTLPMLFFYGLGTILGAGIYVLVGEVAGAAGMQAPFAFLIAAGIAAFSGLSYAELSSRFPQSAGEAVYVKNGLGRSELAMLVGLLVIMVGIVSSATIVNGFVGYFNSFLVSNLGLEVSLPGSLVITCLVAGLGLLAFWGINESVWAATLFTVIEVFGLLLILWVGRGSIADLPFRWHEMVPSLAGMEWTGVLLGGFLAFYAYIGFEDMVNVAEEVKDASRTLPRAIILVLVVTTLLYMAVALVAVLVVAPTELASTGAPLAMIYQQSTGNEPLIITIIAMFAVINGALIQVIMGSRVMYGMSRQGWLPSVLSSIHPVTRTPHVATLLVTTIILALALWLPLVTLAKITSFITLLIFILINVSLVAIKRRASVHAEVSFPMWVPLAGVLTSFTFLGYQFWHWIS